MSATGLKRGIPYNAGTLYFENADDVQSFKLKTNFVGFRLRDRAGNAVIKFAIDSPSQNDVISTITDETPWTNGEFSSDNGRYETIPAGASGGWSEIRVQQDTTIYVTANMDTTRVEVTIFQ